MPNLAVYTPSIFALLLASIFISYPALAVFVVSGALIGFAVIYASVITKLTRIRRATEDRFGNPPGFKQVTIQMFDKGGTWFRH